MNTKRRTTNTESKVMITSAALFRLAGFSALLAGLGIIVMGMFHPANESANVITPAWIIVHIFATSLGFFGVLGLAGLYARQVEKAGWLGLVGFLLFDLWLALVGLYSFIEAAVLPLLASQYPPFVAGFMEMFRSVPSAVNLGVMPTMWVISTPMLIVGALLFGIATFRARILPRWAAGLLVLGTLMVPVGALLPTVLQAKIIMVPMGLGLAWMGYALLTERRGKSADAILGHKTVRVEMSNAD